MLRIKNLSKKFGTFTAVDNINLKILKGDLYGFLGENGAGKTTTMKVIAGLYSPTSGKVLIDNIDIQSDPVTAKLNIGYIPDQPFLYDKLTGREFLYFSGGLYNLTRKNINDKIKEVVDILQIGSWIDKKTEEYSQGMKQRITIASAILHDPKLIILDEPMIGLDPQSALIVKNLLRKKASEGAAVFMSTHSLPVAEELCNRIGIIKNGRIIFEDNRDAVEMLKSNINSSFESLFLELTR
ncbi:MAG: ABC transporter [Ignavibacteria bacterium GWA2_35_9]|nr:MAG: ABC transporter [Ignavibacteria bacterium GWA2_35_9]OGU47435.1 MAG: ABC transporter [Ignavibacteria bacterium GWB2_36_8]OGU49209.1 MAG: ABC transporter [Ignavibacteria bacterium GWC2_36_12]OGV10472.1 MAG: ABC transporter [Ignavibacteria bacterium RIFOXYB2_FULL_36_7]